jgi:hypothetical protein
MNNYTVTLPKSDVAFSCFLSGSREMNSVIPSSFAPYSVKRALHNSVIPSSFRGERRNPPSVTMGISGLRSPIRCKERLAVMPNA